jgi:hypothetical protein
MSLAHDSSMTEHLGVNKNSNCILAHFYCTNIRRDVAKDCSSCNTCQVMWKPIQNIRVAPLRPVPAFEEFFCRLIVDCVGPLPKTK